MNDRILLEDELVELEAIHRKLDTNIAEGHSNYLSDALLVKMKQERLILKREIDRVRGMLGL